jgi:hypothetical protein
MRAAVMVGGALKVEEFSSTLKLMAQATYDDVTLILRLYNLRREEKLRAARAWFSSSFKVKTVAEFNQLCPTGSEPNAFARQVITYWDMVASFINSGVLSQELFFESGRELLFVWTRARALILEWRTAYQDPYYMKNLEAVGEAFAEHLKKRAPEGYENFVARVLR